MGQWIVRDFARPSPAVVRQFADLPTTILSDCMNRFFAMDGGVRPLSAGMRLCGPALTVQSFPGCNWGAHQALTLAKPGDVLVLAAGGGTQSAVWGHVMTAAAQRIPLAGVVIDGCIRDAQANRSDALPIFCRGACPGGPHKGWPCNLNVPVSCAGVPVMPGDIVVGDDDGVVVIPASRAEAVLQEARARQATEQQWYRRLDDGESTLELLGIPPV